MAPAWPWGAPEPSAAVRPDGRHVSVRTRKRPSSSSITQKVQKTPRNVSPASQVASGVRLSAPVGGRAMALDVRSRPGSGLRTSGCTGSWIYGTMGLLDGLAATNRKEPDRVEAKPPGKVPIDRLADIAPAAKISRARVVDQGRIITAGGIASGLEMGFHLLRRAGYGEEFISEVARVMEYTKAYEVYREDLEF